MNRKKLTGLLAAFLLVLVGCASDVGSASGGDQISDETSPTTVVAPTSTTDSAPVAAEPADTGWERHDVDPATGCMCSDGSEFSFWSRQKNPEKVLLFFQGGGACFSAGTCSFTDGSYKVTAAVEGTPGAGSGIFDLENPDNPLSDWSMVFVPYCTGDVHIGNKVTEYSEDLTVNHVGFLNANKGLDYVLDNFADASELLVAGSSAGGVPAPLFGGLAADELPDAQVSVLSDASGAYADNPPVNEAIGALWGTFDNVPDWPENEGLEPKDWSIPGLFTQTGLHNPDVRLARFDNAYDKTQREFSDRTSVSSGDLKEVISANEAQIEANGVPIASYIAPGDAHTILGRPSLYSLNVEGVPFVEWLSEYIGGTEVADVSCVDCGG